MTEYEHGIGIQYRIMKLIGVFGGSKKYIVCKFINFSKGRKAYKGMHIYIGIW
jgi:hypothetical protein